MALVTQPMLQLRLNCTELGSMDLFSRILCRFQKYGRGVPPPSLPFGRKEKRRLKVHVYGSNFFFFPGMFFFRHPSKSCSVFYILETIFFFSEKIPGKIFYFHKRVLLNNVFFFRPK